MGLRARRMKRLSMDEISGVDAPAHRAPGWIVAKSEDGDPDFETQLREVVKQIGVGASVDLGSIASALASLSIDELVAELQSMDPGTLEQLDNVVDVLDDMLDEMEDSADAPGSLAQAFGLAKRQFTAEQRDQMAKDGRAMSDGSFPIDAATDVKNAVSAYGRAADDKKPAVKAHIIKRAKAVGATDQIPADWQAKKSAEEEPMPTNDDKSAETPDKPTDLDSALKAIEALTTRVTKAEDDNTRLRKALGGEPEPEADELTKALATLPEPIRKAFEANQARVTAAEEVAKAERDARLSREYLEKARGYDGLPTKAEEFGTVLREVDEKLSEAAGAELTRVLRAASEIAAKSDQFRQIGGYGADATDGMAAIEKAADELQKADPKLNRATAITKAADLNPDLVGRLNERS